MKRSPRGRGSVFQDKNRGRWVAQLKVNGKLQRKYAHSEEDAWSLRAELVANARLGISTSSTPLGEYLAEWLEGLDVRPSTLTGYRAKTRLYLTPPPIGTVPLGKLAPAHLRRLFKELDERGLSAATIRQTRAILQSALRQAVEDGLVSRNVAALVKPPSIEPEDRRALTPNEAVQLLESLKGDRLEPLYATTILLGLRQGEALGLRWSDIDQVDGGRTLALMAPQESPTRTAGASPPTRPSVLHVRQTLGRKDGKYVYGQPKTKRSRRSIPLPEVIVRLLSERRVIQIAELLSSGARPDHDLVFTTPSGKPINGSWLTHDLYRRLEAAGLPRVRWHDLRHAAASLLLAEGFAPREIMQVLGHSTIAMTMDVYVKVPDETIRERMQRLDGRTR